MTAAESIRRSFRLARIRTLVEIFSETCATVGSCPRCRHLVACIADRTFDPSPIALLEVALFEAGRRGVGNTMIDRGGVDHGQRFINEVSRAGRQYADTKRHECPEGDTPC